MTNEDRVNALLESGIGLSPEAIAAVVGIDVTDVMAYLTTRAPLPVPASGGGGINVQQFNFPDVFDIPGAAGTVDGGNTPRVWQSNFLTIPAGHFVAAGMTCELLLSNDAAPPDTVAQAQVSIAGVLTNLPADIDPSRNLLGGPGPIAVQGAQLGGIGFGSVSGTPPQTSGTDPSWAANQWYYTGSVEQRAFCTWDCALSLYAASLDTNTGLYVAGSQVRNLAITVASWA